MTNAYRRLAGALALASALALSACGGSTVTSDDVASSTSVAPLEHSSSATTTSSRATSSSAQPQDEGAREISSIPSAQPQVDAATEGYLSEISDGGIDVAGVEDQLVGTAQAVCADDPVSAATAGAVAGQLVEQGRTDLAADEVTRIIESSARDAYCP